MAKGVAILAMVMLHLFCRLDHLPYTPLFYVGGKPLVYYLGLFGDMCVPIYCFCSGYAHYLLKEKEGNTYTRKIPGRLFSFLSNYWIVLFLFAGLGLFFDRSGTIPGSLADFAGNLFLYDLSYNGAWWFVVTYIILTVLSPCLYKVTSKMPFLLLELISGIVYVVAYWFQVIAAPSTGIPVLDWALRQTILLGTSQFGYVLGMAFRKKRWITALRTRFSENGGSDVKTDVRNRSVIHVVPLVLFLLHCVEPSLIIAPITGLGTILCFWLWKKPRWAERFFLFFGKHSTNMNCTPFVRQV